MALRFNGVTTSSYSRHELNGNGSALSSNANINQTFIRLDAVSDGGQNANAFDAMILDILDFSNTNKNKTVRSFKGKTGTQQGIRLESGLFRDTSAITSMTFNFALTSENFVSGCRFSLYGIR